MNRNVKQVQKELFELLTKHTSIQLEEYPNIKVFFSKEEYEAVCRDVILIVQLHYGRNQLACIYEYKGNSYLLLPAIYEGIGMASLEPVSDSMPIQFIHYVTNQIEPKDNITEDELLEFVFVDPSIEQVEWESIIKFFPPFTMFKINDVLPFDDGEKLIYLKRLCIEAVCQTGKNHQLPFDSNTISAFSALASSNDNNIPYDNVLRSLLSYHWKFCFIDLYRCQERLLLLAWVDEFKNTMNSGLTIGELYKAMKIRYKTEHHEDENMRLLYNLLPQGTLDLMTKESDIEKKADYIYQLRNRIVHFQHSDVEIESMKDDEWNMIVRFVLTTLPFLYTKLQQYIVELPGV